MNDFRINEAEYDLANGEKGKVAVFFYTGDGNFTTRTFSLIFSMRL